MFTRPVDLPDEDVVRTLADGWALEARAVEYAAVGYGSHHWHVIAGSQRWFASVDDLDARRRDATESRSDVRHRLTAALTVARSLRDAGLDFVIAPLRTLKGDIVHPIDDRFVLAVYPHVVGKAHPWGPYPTDADRLAALELVVGLHAVDASIAPEAQPDDFAIPSRDQLFVALSERDVEWGPGPFAGPALELLRHHGDAVTEALATYDELAARVEASDRPRVLTHGEPHRGNTINTPTGVVLIDWDTARLAPPERDLWMLLGEDPAMAEAYTERTGRAVDDVAVRLYRMWWDLCEISLFVADLRRPHGDTEDNRVAWQGLQASIGRTGTAGCSFGKALEN